MRKEQSGAEQNVNSDNLCLIPLSETLSRKPYDWKPNKLNDRLSLTVFEF